MKFIISGSTGLVGSHLSYHLQSQGHIVYRLVRSRDLADSNHIFWNPAAKSIDSAQFENTDVVIHLAGENIAQGRWNAEKKKAIRDSRIDSTHLLAETLLNLKNPPKLFLGASAIGYYGNRKSTPLDEGASPGVGFLARVCQDWERETAPLKSKNIRVVNLRFGIILSDKGGALKKMLLPFKLGLGGKMGSGNQYMSWVTLPDAVGIIDYIVHADSVEGPVNVVSPTAVTNSVFTKTLGRTLNRPTLFPMPALAARLVFGEVADALLLASTRVEPRVLIDAGYTFKHPTLDHALQNILNN